MSSYTNLSIRFFLMPADRFPKWKNKKAIFETYGEAVKYIRHTIMPAWVKKCEDYGKVTNVKCVLDDKGKKNILTPNVLSYVAFVKNDEFKRSIDPRTIYIMLYYRKK